MSESPTFEDYMFRLDGLVLKALEPPEKPASPAVLFQIALALQARELVYARFFLKKGRHLIASWLCVRSLAEIVIKMKWLGKSHSRFCCLVIGEELESHRRMSNDRQRHRLKRAAMKAVSERLDWLLASVQKRGSYWNKKRKQFRGPPTIKEMAEQADALTVYKNQFRYASLHVDSSTRMFNHVEALEGGPVKVMFLINADKKGEVQPDRSLFNLWLQIMFLLKKRGAQ